MWPFALIGTGIALAYAATRGPKNVVSVKSRTDNREYLVQNFPDKQEACEKMATIRGNLEKLIDHYKSDPASAADPRISVLISRFKPDVLVENDINADSTSYSENKGDKIVVCLRNKTPPYSLVDTNTVMFVVLHEMAHLMTTTIGHTSEFWVNFRRILHDACSIQIYTNVNYDKNPVSYCGMTITSTPV